MVMRLLLKLRQLKLKNRQHFSLLLTYVNSFSEITTTVREWLRLND